MNLEESIKQALDEAKIVNPGNPDKLYLSDSKKKKIIKDFSLIMAKHLAGTILYEFDEITSEEETGSTEHQEALEVWNTEMVQLLSRIQAQIWEETGNVYSLFRYGQRPSIKISESVENVDELSEAREYQLQAYKEDGTMEVSNWHSKENFVLDLKRKVDKDESYESTMIMKRIAEMEYEEDEDEIKPTLEKKYGMETKKEAVELDEAKTKAMKFKLGKPGRDSEKEVQDFVKSNKDIDISDVAIKGKDVTLTFSKSIDTKDKALSKFIDNIRKNLFIDKKIALVAESVELDEARKRVNPYDVLAKIRKTNDKKLKDILSGALNTFDISYDSEELIQYIADEMKKAGYSPKEIKNMTESVELDEANKYSSEYDKLIKRAAKLPWDKKPKVRKSGGNVEYFGEVDGYKVEFAVQNMGPASYFTGLNLAAPGRSKYTYLFKDSGEKILDTVFAGGVSDKDQKVNIDDFEKALDMIETGAFKKEVKESVDPLEEIMSLKERTNDDTYSWQQINKAMMNAGYGARQILQLVKALKGKQINKGDMGNKDAYYWANVNQALMKDVGLSPSAIFKVLQQLNKLK